MSKKLLIILGVVVILGGLLYVNIKGSYNSMQTLDENVDNSWGQVENVYQRRSDLIPNLVNTVKGYADFEKETLTGVIEARSKATSVNIDPSNLNESNMQQFQQAQDGLSSALSRLMVVVERYPDLKANQSFLELQAQLEGTENRIAVERQRYNDSVKSLNGTIRQFPMNIWAGLFDIDKRPYFKAEAGAENAPEVNFD